MKPYSNNLNLNHKHFVAGVFLREVEKPSSWLDVDGISNELYYCLDRQVLHIKCPNMLYFIGRLHHNYKLFKLPPFNTVKTGIFNNPFQLQGCYIT